MYGLGRVGDESEVNSHPFQIAIQISAEEIAIVTHQTTLSLPKTPLRLDFDSDFDLEDVACGGGESEKFEG
jgi:hypothetical protein